MARQLRKIIVIDEEKCDGCGTCVPACAEGALAILHGKARLSKESYCDGLGACLGECPQGALTIRELEADAYDEAAVEAHVDALQARVRRRGGSEVADLAPTGPVSITFADRPPVAGCPSMTVRLWETNTNQPEARARAASALRQWPVQLHLVPPDAPYFQGAPLTLVADCVPFAVPDFHQDYLRGTAIAIGCPKLDDGLAYVRNVTRILQASDVRSLRVLYMEVPCCRGLVTIAQQALIASGKEIPFETEMIAIR